MKITFNALGLLFEAEVVYLPSTPATAEHPGDPADINFLWITCDGYDAEFLFSGRSSLVDEIYDAAHAKLKYQA